MARIALVTGASGLLGRQVVKAFERDQWHVVGVGFARANPPSILKVDICDPAEIEKALDIVKPEVVVHCAAQRFPDRVDADPSAAHHLNVTASKFLAFATSSRNILLVYISTDYVFSGKPGEAPYESDFQPSPTNLYGQTKLDGENAILQATSQNNNGVVLRVPVLYGPTSDGNKESAVNTLMDSVQKAQQEEVVMDDWSIRYPTNTEDVGRVCVDVSRTFLAASTQHRQELQKVLQFSSEDRYTKYEICQVLADVMGLTMGKMEANKQGNGPSAKVQRPYDCHLSTKALRDLGIDVQTQDFKAWWRWHVGAYRK